MLKIIAWEELVEAEQAKFVDRNLTSYMYNATPQTNRRQANR
jgi:hypothetical protein